MARQSRPDRLSVLMTRPAGAGVAFADALQARFGPFDIIDSPLLRPVFLRPDLPKGRFGALILTSQTAVQAMAGCDAELPRLAFCVGDRTAEAAHLAGLETISAKGDADALVALILASGETGPLLHLRGADSRGAVASRLSAAGIPTVEAIVYRQEAQPLTEAAQVALTGTAPLILPVFSPRTAQLLAEALLARPPVAPLWIAALSDAVAGPLRDRAARLAISARPEAGALIAAIGGMLSTLR